MAVLLLFFQTQVSMEKVTTGALILDCGRKRSERFKTLCGVHEDQIQEGKESHHSGVFVEHLGHHSDSLKVSFSFRYILFASGFFPLLTSLKLHIFFCRFFYKEDAPDETVHYSVCICFSVLSLSAG